MRVHSLLIAAALVQSASASVIITISQVGSDVVETGSGTLNLAGLTLSTTALGSLHINPAGGVIEAGPTGQSSISAYRSADVAGPMSFGSGGSTNPTSGSGDFFGFNGNAGDLLVAASYTSGSSLSASDTFSNTSLSLLGLTPGSYVWTWGSGRTADSLTLNVTSATPEPGSLSLLAFGIVSLGFLSARQRAR